LKRRRTYSFFFFLGEPIHGCLISIISSDYHQSTLLLLICSTCHHLTSTFPLSTYHHLITTLRVSVNLLLLYILKWLVRRVSHLMVF
jgi:hypothetical protein